MNSKLISMTLGAALTLTSAFAHADHGRWRDRDDEREWGRERHERRHEGPKAWGRVDEHPHFRYYAPEWRPRFHHHHHRHDRWCGHRMPREDRAYWSSRDIDDEWRSSITFILRGDLN